MRLIKIVVESFNTDSIPAVSSFSFSIDLPLDDDNKNTMVIKLSNFLHATVPESRAGPGAGDIAEGEGVCFVATKGTTGIQKGKQRKQEGATWLNQRAWPMQTASLKRTRSLIPG